LKNGKKLRTMAVLNADSTLTTKKLAQIWSLKILSTN